MKAQFLTVVALYVLVFLGLAEFLGGFDFAVLPALPAFNVGPVEPGPPPVPDLPAVPNPPETFPPVTGPATAKIAWDAPTTNSDGTPLLESDIESYTLRVYWGYGGPAIQTIVTTEKTANVVFPEIGYGYKFTVTAKHVNGNESDPSPELNFRA